MGKTWIYDELPFIFCFPNTYYHIAWSYNTPLKYASSSHINVYFQGLVLTKFCNWLSPYLEWSMNLPIYRVKTVKMDFKHLVKDTVLFINGQLASQVWRQSYDCPNKMQEALNIMAKPKTLMNLSRTIKEPQKNKWQENQIDIFWIILHTSVPEVIYDKSFWKEIHHITPMHYS